MTHRAPAALLILLSWLGLPATAQIPDETAPPQVAVNSFELSESNFELWIYGDGQRTSSTKDRLGTLLLIKVGEVEAACPLSETQRGKLVLAGQGDQKRFLDRVAEAHRVFERYKHDQNSIGPIQQVTQPLAASLALGLHGDGSLFAKALATILDPVQAARYREAGRERDRSRYRAKVAIALANLDNAIGLTAEQYHKLLDLALAETAPPAKQAGNYETMLILYKLARLPESKVRPLLDEPRWKSLRRLLEAANQREAFLKAQGLLDEPGPSKD